MCLQFAMTQVMAFAACLPVMFAMEGARWGVFLETICSSRELQIALLVSGMTFYLYNELATYTIKETGAVTASVANTAKRVIVMVYMAFVTGRVLTSEQKVGAAIAIGGVLLYSVADDVVPRAGGVMDERKRA